MDSDYVNNHRYDKFDVLHALADFIKEFEEFKKKPNYPQQIRIV